MSFIEQNRKRRKLFLPAGGQTLRLPVYFPSISSVKTGLSPFEYFKILIALKQPNFLVSAYDVDNAFQKKDFITALKENHLTQGSLILMDSGNYESFWIRDNTWNIESLNKILKENVCDLAFCFDNQFPPKDINQNSIEIIGSTKNSQAISSSTTIIPIVHCNKNDLTETVIKLYEKINFLMVAIPERILGDGLLERMKTIVSLRKELNKLNDYTYIHLLGTGNPHSLLLLSLAGADSFDGLEWCQTTVDSKSGVLHHFQQRELIKDDCNFCNDPELDYMLKTLGHNLIFYNEWMKKIQDSIVTNTELKLVKQYFSPTVVEEIMKILF